VVWLNEAQHYFGDRAAGERIAAAVHHLLVSSERAPVLVLGTLWPDYVDQYTALPLPGQADPHSRVRELLTGRTLTIPDAFDATHLASAEALAEDGDWLLADALTRARADGRLTQDLAGAPVLLDRYERGSPAARAVLQAAMDARRLGVGLNLPQAFLTHAASDYLSQSEYDALTEDWAEQAFAYLAALVHGKQAALHRSNSRPRRRPPGTPPPTRTPTSPVFRLADHLEQHGRTTRRHLCPPSFWYSAHTHLTHPDDLNNLALSAQIRHRRQWAHHLRHRAADHGHPDALAHPAARREVAGDREGAETLARQAAEQDNPYDLAPLGRAAGGGRDREGAETLARQAADHGYPHALVHLVALREEAGDRESAETLARQAADSRCGCRRARPT
jgi:hypothetical protein